MERLSYLDKVALTSPDYIQESEPGLRQLAKEIGYKLSHALKTTPNKKTYYFDKEVGMDLLEPLAKKLEELPSRCEVGLNYHANSLEITINELKKEAQDPLEDLKKQIETKFEDIDAIDGSLTPEVRALHPDQYAEFDREKERIKSDFSIATTIEELQAVDKETEQLSRMSLDMKDVFEKLKAENDQKTSDEKAAEEVAAKEKSDQAASNKEKEEQEAAANKEWTIRSNTPVYDMETNSLTRYPRTETVHIVKPYKETHSIIENKYKERYLVYTKALSDNPAGSSADTSKFPYKVKSGTKVKNLTSGETRTLEEDMPVSMNENESSGTSWFVTNENQEHFVINPEFIVKATLKKALYAPREYPEAGETLISPSDIQEHPFDRYSPGSGASYVSLPNVGDVMGDRTNTRGYAGEAEWADKKVPKLEYQKLLDEAILLKAPKALIEYYNELVERG